MKFATNIFPFFILSNLTPHPPQYSLRFYMGYLNCSDWLTVFTCVEGSSDFSIALITCPYQKDKGLTLACNSIGMKFIIVEKSREQQYEASLSEAKLCLFINSQEAGVRLLGEKSIKNQGPPHHEVLLSRCYLLNIPWVSCTVPPTGNQVSKYTSPSQLFPIHHGKLASGIPEIQLSTVFQYSWKQFGYHYKERVMKLFLW